ncbi:unnamed protein product [Ambrosiozyma monospora]|uniref:Unnamed protein product n=1 Tax=Ambrosiozyma monospora TaxID=43982 RepID=A0ACB5TG13_AMBMO|nr:unnamed protein product [Ambrosiozyma monospora]
MTKIVIELDAEFDVVRKNILNLREFLVSHLDSSLKHTVKNSISFPTFWRLCEANIIAKGITKQQKKYDEKIVAGLDGLLTQTESILEDLSTDFREIYQFRTELKIVQAKEEVKTQNENKELSFDQLQQREKLRRLMVKSKKLESQLQSSLLLFNSIVHPTELLNNPRKFEGVVSSVITKTRTEIENVQKLQFELANLVKSDKQSIKPNYGTKFDKVTESVQIANMASTIKTKKALSAALQDRMLLPSKASLR